MQFGKAAQKKETIRIEVVYGDGQVLQRGKGFKRRIRV